MHFLDSIQGEDRNFTGALLTLIGEQRNGAIVDQELVKKITNSFAVLGIDEENLTKESLDVYKEQFEELYVKETSTYITTKLEAFITDSGVCLEEAQKLFVAEAERARLYIRTFDPKEFIRSFFTRFLDDEQLWTGYEKSLEDTDDEHLHCLHTFAQSPLESAHQNIGQFDEI